MLLSVVVVVVVVVVLLLIRLNAGYIVWNYCNFAL